MREDRPKVALYARVSTDVQALSLDGQIRELTDHARAAGLEVAAEVLDRGEKRRTLERPGIDELLDLAATGGLDEVWAWAWDRFGEYPTPEMLALELEDHGVRLRSLDDGGEGDDAEDMRIIKSLFSRREGRTRVRRSARGRTDKALRGEVFGGFRARYGFAFVAASNGKGREVNVGYRVEQDQVAVVRRVFAMVADGASLHAVSRAFEEEGVPNPSGGPRWSRTTLRNLLTDDVFRPHGFEEIRAAVSPNVAATLDPGKVYGISWSGRKRSRFASSRGKKRVVYEAPREEWTAVPVDLSGSGLDRATVDRARERVEGNKSPSKAGDRFWELSGGVLRCAECGRAMITYRRAKKGGHNHYYRCRPSSTVDACENRKSHRAENLEYLAARTFEEYASQGTLLALYDEAVRERHGVDRMHAGMKRRTALAEKLAELDTERWGHLKQNAKGFLSDGELVAMLAEVDEQREAVAAELRASEDEAAEAGRLRAARDALAAYSPVHAEWYEDPDAITPGEYLTLGAGREEIRRAYSRYGARFEVDPNGELTLKMELDLGNDALQFVSTT